MKNLVVSIAAVFLLSAAPPTGEPAIRVADSLSTATGLSVRGTITNNFLPDGSARCDNASFVLLVTRGVIPGIAHCRSSDISPGTKTRFHVDFPPVSPGVYYLRYTKIPGPAPQYEIVPLRLRIKTDSKQ